MDLKFAIIDIGSNSIRYMDKTGKRLLTTRLAEGLAASGALSPAAVERSLDAIAGFAKLAQVSGLVPRAYATSAVRDAKNRAEFVAAVQNLGVAVEVLPGELEARLAYLGATGGSGGLLDVGGGSAQLTGDGFALSFPMGCVRARELVPPCDTLQALRTGVYLACRDIFSFPAAAKTRWTGVGGTVTTLAALKGRLTHYDPSAVSGAALSQADIWRLTQALFHMGEKRAAHPLLKDRHDVILYGALIVLYIMENMDIKKLHASDKDGMEGYYEYLIKAPEAL